jgi:hypothetical protein
MPEVKEFIACVTLYFGIVLILDMEGFRAKVMWSELHFYHFLTAPSVLVSFLGYYGNKIIPRWQQQFQSLSHLTG